MVTIEKYCQQGTTLC